jgi:hypothetical protein
MQKRQRKKPVRKEDVFPPTRLNYSYALFHAEAQREMQKKQRKIAGKERRRLSAYTAKL